MLLAQFGWENRLEAVGGDFRSMTLEEFMPRGVLSSQLPTGFSGRSLWDRSCSAKDFFGELSLSSWFGAFN